MYSTSLVGFTELVEDCPVTLDAWEAGPITRAHVGVITDTGAHLPLQCRPDFGRADALVINPSRDTPR